MKNCNFCPPIVLCPYRSLSINILIKESVNFTRQEREQCNRLSQSRAARYDQDNVTGNLINVMPDGM
jgi:hypothetical protein